MLLNVNTRSLKCSCYSYSWKVSLTDHESFEDEHQDGFSNVVTNASTRVVIGVSGSGVLLICSCVLIYFLYKLWRSPPRPRIEPMPYRSTEPNVIYVREAEAVANPNGAPCPRCRNVPSSAHSAWSELEFPMVECICMAAPPRFPSKDYHNASGE